LKKFGSNNLRGLNYLMVEQKLDDKNKKETEARLESDNYLLNFLDSLYAGIIAFSFTIIYSTLVKQNELISENIVEHLILFLMAFAFIIADWTGSRALANDYQYLSKSYYARARVVIDIMIGCLYFVLIICASLLSSTYIFVFSIVFCLGAIWTSLIRVEYKELEFFEKKIGDKPSFKEQIEVDPRLQAIKWTHVILTVIFLIFWVIACFSQKPWTNTGVLWGVITSFWSVFILFKIFCWIKLPKSQEADKKPKS
jgi:hypothetical protein